MEPVTRFHPGSFTGLWNSRCFIVEPIAKAVYSVTPGESRGPECNEKNGFRLSLERRRRTFAIGSVARNYFI